MAEPLDVKELFVFVRSISASGKYISRIGTIAVRHLGNDFQ